jgi:hypothetical protein
MAEIDLPARHAAGHETSSQGVLVRPLVPPSGSRDSGLREGTKVV